MSLGKPRFELRHRVLLWAAGILHDIGADPAAGNKPNGHANRSFEVILNEHPNGIPELDISTQEIATVAGLHGNDEPSSRILELWKGNIPEDLRALAAILRVADGCDRSCEQKTADVRISQNVVELYKESGKPRSAMSTDRLRARAKQQWLNEIFGITVA